MILTPGFDCSQYQGDIDFAKAWADGYRFVIIRATFGCPDPGEPDSKYIDPWFVKNITAARAIGFAIGIYHYSYPEYNTPQNEAAFFARVVNPYLQAGDFTNLDFEENYTRDPAGWSRQWLDAVTQELGFKPLFYSFLAKLKQYDWSTVINAGYGLWLAQWTYKADGVYDTSQPWPFAAIMQWSDNGSISGITGRVDQDVFFGTIDELKKYGKPAPVEAPPTPAPTPEPPTPDPAPDPQPTPPTPTVEVKQEDVTVSVQFPIETQDDPNLELGQRLTTQDGANGTDTVTYNVTYTDGVETSREVANTVHTTLPTPEVVNVGTKPIIVQEPGIDVLLRELWSVIKRIFTKVIIG